MIVAEVRYMHAMPEKRLAACQRDANAIELGDGRIHRDKFTAGTIYRAPTREIPKQIQKMAK